MSVLKYKDANGDWQPVTSLNQVVTVEKEVIVTDMSNLEWKEIEVPVTAGSSYYTIDCSAANIDLLENKSWMLCASSPAIDGWYPDFYPVSDGDAKPIIISPIVAAAKGEDIDGSKIGIYSFDVSGYGFNGFGSDFYKLQSYAFLKKTGVNGTGIIDVYSNYFLVDTSYFTSFQSTAKLIYLADKED